MIGRSRWALGVALSCGLCFAGCQSSRDGLSRLPSFGLDNIPSQSEPPVEESGEIRTASATNDADDDDDEPSGRKGNFLSRLLPGKSASENRALPLSSKKSADDDDDDD